MIKLFSNIRQKLLAEGKTSNYLKYAIGEIVLVMIGILLALQINNWNEVRKDRAYEVKMLAQIKKALEQDHRFFTEHLLGRRNKTVKNAVNFFKNSILKDSADQDSVNFHFHRLIHGLQITYNRGPYEALKTSGLDKISNDSLRNRLIYVYDFIYPRYEGLITIGQDSYFEKAEPLQELLSIREGISVVNDEVVFEGTTMKPTDFKTNLDFLELLKSASEYASDTKMLLKRLIPFMEGLIALIDEEIDRN